MLFVVPSTANARPMLPSHCYKLLMDQRTLNRLVEKCGMKVHMWYESSGTCWRRGEIWILHHDTHGIDRFYYLHCDLYNIIIVTAGFHSILMGLYNSIPVLYEIQSIIDHLLRDVFGMGMRVLGDKNNWTLEKKEKRKESF